MNQNNLLVILEAQLSGEKQKLFEGSLSRIMAHANNADKVGFAILTSWRQANSKSVNNTNFEALQNAVRAKGFGYIKLRGHWRECQDPNVSYDQCPASELIDSIEPSIMVFGINHEQAMAFGVHFNQDAVVYAGPETEGKVKLSFKDGSSMELGTFSPMALGQAYSEYRTKEKEKEGGLQRAARYFMFEGWSYPAQGFVEKLVEQTLQKNIEVLTGGIGSIKKKG